MTGSTLAGEEDVLIEQLFKGERIPVIVAATDGTALAFARTGRIFRRSTDGGKTWCETQEVGDDAEGSAIVDENNGDVMVVAGRKGHLWRSSDNGATWAREEIEIKANPLGHGSPDNVPACTGASESGVTLQHGEHEGRLLMPARVQPPEGNNDQEW